MIQQLPLAVVFYNKEVAYDFPETGSVHDNFFPSAPSASQLLSALMELCLSLNIAPFKLRRKNFISAERS